MKLDEAMPILTKACGQKFSVLFANHPKDLSTNKGHVGQMLTKHVGLVLNSDLCDFEDGELKSNKSFADGRPRETMFITQISKIIDTLIRPKPVRFEDSPVLEKIQNLVYLPVVKESKKPGDWYFTRCVRVRVQPGSPLYSQLSSDYYDICAKLRKTINTPGDGMIHTSSGQYLQVRSKDSKPYHPIYSELMGKKVSGKNHAFYFKKAFMIDALNGEFD